ncbi:lipopolysaccharide biosynthesis protein [Gordonibacter massiliensis (ex Traore et al. 2017)]|uniref:lipopolysaccharide biosynthesis protein n=1 Tax=Gordonibacter massiliensis (ex Traore et al. 2017) TaxID=1841863 RepID=UPI001C8B3C17|nr:oligosaccharide flippase family protein [Gordonibacter massiliensis (ex Traore et al. 2017)]MBX9034602.1 oligosaccharide flippase family protein [Gordonibacter massiliensis (ex Traore et al. 2017)]
MRLVSTYRALQRPVKATLWFAFANFFQKGIAFLLIPVFTRFMLPEQYGQYSVFQSWYSVLVIVVTLSLGKSVFHKGMVEFADSKEQYTSSMVGLGMLSTAIFTVVYLAAPSFWNGLTGLSTELTLLMFVEFFFFSAFDCWCSRKRFDFDYAGVVALSLIIAAVTAIVSVPAVVLTHSEAPGAEGLVAIVCKVVVSIVVYAIPLIFVLKKSREVFNWKYWKFALLFNLPVIVHLLSTVLLQNADRLMIAQICGDYEAGIYSIAYSMAMVLLIVNVSINGSLTPWTFKAIEANSVREIRRIGSIYLVFVAFINVLLVCVAPEVVNLVATEAYRDAVYIIPPVAASVVFIALQDLFLNIEYYYSKTKLIMGATVIAATVNVLLNLVFINLFGYLAAGYTTLVCYVLVSVVHFACYRSICMQKKLNGFYDLRFLVVVALVSTIFMLCMLLLYPYPTIRYAFLLLLAAVAFLKRKAIGLAIRTLISNRS